MTRDKTTVLGFIFAGCCGLVFGSIIYQVAKMLGSYIWIALL